MTTARLMETTGTARIQFHDCHPHLSSFRDEVLAGLAKPQKAIPPKFFYDKRGSELFERITGLEEYYPTRAEMEILEQRSGEIAGRMGEDSLLIEFGSGSSRKIRLLLDALQGRNTYIAIDISKDHLIESAETLSREYPELEVSAVCADYTQRFPLPQANRKNGGRKAVFFPGSTIGNFTREQAEEFLKTTAELLRPEGDLLIGVDLKKDPATLNAAYNDAEGVTAAFNLNLLERINSELNGDFDLSSFEHRAFYNEAEGRVEIYLVSRKRQTARVDSARFEFQRGEAIHTENSYKYSISEFRELASRLGFEPVRAWTDSHDLFSLHYLEVRA